MLSVATAPKTTAIEGRGAPAVMQIGWNRRPLGSTTLADGAMWPNSGAPALSHGNHMCHSVPERGRTALPSGECPLRAACSESLGARLRVGQGVWVGGAECRSASLRTPPAQRSAPAHAPSTRAVIEGPGEGGCPSPHHLDNVRRVPFCMWTEPFVSVRNRE